MVARIFDSELEARLIQERQASGGDRYDEVWDGEYILSPLANNEHQRLATRLAAIFDLVLGEREDVWVLAGANVSDQENDWTTNYRCPDVVVVLPGSKAVDRGPYWLGGPDLVVEVVSRGDRSYEKFDFYSKIGVREVLIVNRNPWSLEIYRPDSSGALCLLECSSAAAPEAIPSEILGATLRLIPKQPRPSIEVYSLLLPSDSW